MGDSRAYDDWALRLAGGDWIGGEVFYQAPLYPYFLGAIYSVLGRNLVAVRLVQAFVGSLSCVLLLLAGRRLVSPRAGVIAGLLLAVWAPAIFFDGLVQKSVLDVFFVCLVLWLMAPREARGGEPWRWLSLGLALGALALTRENALVFAAVIAGWALAQADRWRKVALLAAGLVIVLGPVAARNHYVGGGLYITTSQFGPNFYIGNNARADGTYASLRFGRGAPEYERQDATELAERALGRRLSAGEVSRYWIDQAVQFITAHPGAWLELMGRKLALLGNATEMVDTESQETHAEWSWPLRVLGPVTTFGILVPLALFGLIAVWPVRGRLAVVLALTLSYAASVLLFYVFARYRYPLVPLLVLFAAAGLSDARAVLRRRHAGLALAGVAAAAVFANWPIVPRDWLRAVSENNIAVALQADGRYDEAIAHYRRALALRPEYAPALNNLGTTFRAAGRLDDAIATLEQALARRADYPDAHYNLANALTDAGRPGEAVAHFRRALESLPASADVHNNLGIALVAEGSLDAAIGEFRQAVGADPRSSRARRNLGDALVARGATEEGLEQLRQAAALAPDDGPLRYDLGSALLEAGRPADAARELREAVERMPDSAPAHNNFGIALGSQGRLDEAIEQFRAALALQPEFADARRNLEMALASRKRPRP